MSTVASSRASGHSSSASDSSASANVIEKSVCGKNGCSGWSSRSGWGIGIGIGLGVGPPVALVAAHHLTDRQAVFDGQLQQSVGSALQVRSPPR